MRAAGSVRVRRERHPAERLLDRVDRPRRVVAEERPQRVRTVGPETAPRELRDLSVERLDGTLESPDRLRGGGLA